MTDAAVNLIIKAPNQQIKDQIVKCDLDWTIGRLKEYLSEVYPSKPESLHQKLIYSGQLLNDSARLKDILRQHDDLENQFYTVHLVYPSQKTKCAVKTTSDQSRTIDRDTDTMSTIKNSHTRNNSVQNQSQENINVTSPQSQQMYLPEQYFDPQNSQQLAWIQQVYTHYFTQYMQLMAAQGVQLQANVSYLQQMNINTSDVTQNTHMSNHNNNNIVGDEQVQPPAQDAIDVNAGNNGANEDVAFNRDWLDLFYMLSRIVVLFGIVYFYSSPLRFLIVTFLGFAIYLYQGGFFRVQPILLAENNNGRVDNNNQVLQNEAAGPQIVPQQQNAQVPTVQPEARTNPNEENEEQRPGALAFTWTFFSSFFASLIPDQPNVI